jgi:hypothetical protein
MYIEFIIDNIMIQEIIKNYIGNYFISIQLIKIKIISNK